MKKTLQAKNRTNHINQNHISAVFNHNFRGRMFLSLYRTLPRIQWRKTTIKKETLIEKEINMKEKLEIGTRLFYGDAS